jgi:hypothetical protein
MSQYKIASRFVRSGGTGDVRTAHQTLEYWTWSTAPTESSHDDVAYVISRELGCRDKNFVDSTQDCYDARNA